MKKCVICNSPVDTNSNAPNGSDDAPLENWRFNHEDEDDGVVCGNCNND